MPSDYITRVWNLRALTGIPLFHTPLKELLFAPFFGTYWSGVDEHSTWMRTVSTAGSSREWKESFNP
jgi:hypothetical protein